MNTKVIALALPEYDILAEPDYEGIGAKIDKALEDNFTGKQVALRAISLAEHCPLTLDELVAEILRTGWDRYNPNRASLDRHFDAYRPDMHAGVVTIGQDHFGEGADFVRKFYENILLDRGYRLRIDVILIYDRDRLVQAEKADPDKPSVHPRLEPYLFRFKDPNNKQAALLGILKLTK